jgi:hypothetical protein
MSNGPHKRRQPTPPPDGVGELFNALEGQLLPGGCTECDAEQRLEEVEPGSNVWLLVVGHESHCQFFRAHQAGTN